MKKYNTYTMELYEQEGINFHNEYCNWKYNIQHTIENLSYSDGSYKINPISHVIYFTNTNRPNKLNSVHIEMLFNSINRINKEDKFFKHYFWTNDPKIVPEEIRNIENVEIKNIEEFSDHILWEKLSAKVTQCFTIKKYCAQASDIARILITHRFGGFYHDVDYEVYNARKFLQYMKTFDFFGTKEFAFENSYMANSLIAAKPEHPVTTKAIELMVRNFHLDIHQRPPEYVLNPDPSTNNFVFFESGPVMLTVAFLKAKNSDNNNDLMFPPHVLSDMNYGRSLYPNLRCYTHMTAEEQAAHSEVAVGADVFCGNWWQ